MCIYCERPPWTLFLPKSQQLFLKNFGFTYKNFPKKFNFNACHSRSSQHWHYSREYFQQAKGEREKKKSWKTLKFTDSTWRWVEEKTRVWRRRRLFQHFRQSTSLISRFEIEFSRVKLTTTTTTTPLLTPQRTSWIDGQTGWRESERKNSRQELFQKNKGLLIIALITTYRCLDPVAASGLIRLPFWT